MNGAEKQLAILCINETGVSARKLRAYASEKEAAGATFNEGRSCTSLVVNVKERLNHFGRIGWVRVKLERAKLSHYTNLR